MLFKKKIEGLIGHFQLTDWWFSTFDKNEMSYIVKKYGINLIEGNNFILNRSSCYYLANLSTWFLTTKDIEIARKFIYKAEELYDSDISINDKHFYYLFLIEFYYKDRENNNSYIKAIEYCKKQIEISKEASIYFKNEQPSCNLPRHIGFEQLAIIYEKEKKISESLELCQIAYNEGWSGDWEKRIEKLKKRI
ncbi:MAG: hypothetical protein A2015_10100 [Spirochaetes bacterium GWF1_31_7]|nr:MAG: hypothetical protein A2Y30_10105 [Spirochaetes bacterium GWE1_32_154]OHD51607.1 MAG: hypothetical protein A2015_10100 [Spirochaetes bacterium GWF1_31_7]OHD52164.1 MAG: hypothetical protein A2Y29_16975 [Spirochaetes bacterium GWE2_31_10]HBD94211.1 hypothetical protein [Spirochaetia bacterium]HBI39317.1 hypothetical protein [Spirochaetia bacterium]